MKSSNLLENGKRIEALIKCLMLNKSPALRDYFFKSPFIDIQLPKTPIELAKADGHIRNVVERFRRMILRSERINCEENNTEMSAHYEIYLNASISCYDALCFCLFYFLKKNINDSEKFYYYDFKKDNKTVWNFLKSLGLGGHHWGELKSTYRRLLKLRHIQHHIGDLVSWHDLDNSFYVLRLIEADDMKKTQEKIVRGMYPNHTSYLVGEDKKDDLFDDVGNRTGKINEFVSLTNALVYKHIELAFNIILDHQRMLLPAVQDKKDKIEI